MAVQHGAELQDKSPLERYKEGLELIQTREGIESVYEMQFVSELKNKRGFYPVFYDWKLGKLIDRPKFGQTVLVITRCAGTGDLAAASVYVPQKAKRERSVLTKFYADTFTAGEVCGDLGREFLSNAYKMATGRTVEQDEAKTLKDVLAKQQGMLADLLYVSMTRYCHPLQLSPEILLKWMFEYNGSKSELRNHINSHEHINRYYRYTDVDCDTQNGRTNLFEAARYYVFEDTPVLEAVSLETYLEQEILNLNHRLSRGQYFWSNLYRLRLLLQAQVSRRSQDEVSSPQVQVALRNLRQMIVEDIRANKNKAMRKEILSISEMIDTHLV